MNEQITAPRREAQEAVAQHQRITATFPVTLTTSDSLKAAVQEFQKIAARTSSPEGALVHLYGVLEQFPQIELDSLTWSVEGPGERREARPGTAPAKASPPAPGTPAAAAPGSQLLEIQGRVQATQLGDYRAITEHVQRFAAALTADKWELEDLAFRYVEPELYKQIARMVDERRINREIYINDMASVLQKELKMRGVKADVSGRPKHIYSIWRKMRRKGVDFDHIYDVRAVRVLVNEVSDCYAALGIVHTLWRPIPGEFDDYIAAPKDNFYRSLHTAVLDDNGKTLEVQIRTLAMHEDAEFGIAAHWRYKEGVKYDPTFDRKINWLRSLMEWKEDIADASEFIDQVKSEVFAHAAATAL